MVLLNQGRRVRGIVALTLVASAALFAACGGSDDKSSSSSSAAAPAASSDTAAATSAAASTEAASTDAASTEAASTDAASTDAASTDAAASTEASADVAPYTGATADSGKGLKVGYISLGESVPFVKLVSDNIKEQAKLAGVDLSFCDSQLDAAKALDCAKTFKTEGVQGIINFQVNEKASPEICAAGPDVPTLAIDIHQKPCEKAFMGADNERAGFLAGEKLGQYFKDNFNCEFDVLVGLGQPAAGIVDTQRTGGARKGFESVCGAVQGDKWREVDGGGTIDGGQKVFTDTLTALTGKKKIAIVSLNDDMLLGAFAAAKLVNRQGDIYGVGQGADPTSWDNIRTNPNWIADAAYFPEKYGTIAIPAIIDLINGKTVQANLFVNHIVVDKTNIDQIYPK